MLVIIWTASAPVPREERRQSECSYGGNGDPAAFTQAQLTAGSGNVQASQRSHDAVARVRSRSRTDAISSAQDWLALHLVAAFRTSSEDEVGDEEDKHPI